MLNHVASRLALSVPVLFGVLLFGFLLLQLVPADPAAIIAGPTASPELIAEIRKDLGLDRPSWCNSSGTWPACCRAISASR